MIIWKIKKILFFNFVPINEMKLTKFLGFFFNLNYINDFFLQFIYMSIKGKIKKKN